MESLLNRLSVRLIFLISISVPFSLGLIAQSEKGWIAGGDIPDPAPHYMVEYTFDRPSDPKGWDQLESGLHAGFGSTSELYLRCELPDGIPDELKWKGTGWRGERLSTQLLVWSADSLSQVRIQVGDLAGESGAVIARESIHLHLVRYVLSNYPYEADGFSCDAAMDSVWLLPDRLEPYDRFDLPGKTVRPVWISMDIPQSTRPGDYVGNIEVSSFETVDTLQLCIRVQNQVLPGPEDWHFRLDLWQNPWVVARHFQVDPWSEEHKLLLRNHLKLYADAGGTYVTTYAIHSPWSDNSFTLEGAMIEWIKTREGQWSFDYTVFDTYVRLCEELGIDRAITVYTPVPWGYRFRYLDEKTGNYLYETWEPDSARFKKNWNIFLNDLKEHLMGNGWFSKTYLGINENPLEITLSAIHTIRENSTEWKVTYAGNWQSELSELLDDYCPIISSEPSRDELKLRSDRGFTTTYYVCCTPPKPNNFVFSPPVEGRFMGWYAASFGYDGFLRWAYDAWPSDPNRDARHTVWAAGDCFLVYPGGNSSIRFEKLREGIVDYEKIRILREQASHSKKKEVTTAAGELEYLLSGLSEEREFGKRDFEKERLIKSIERGNRILVELSEALSE